MRTRIDCILRSPYIVCGVVDTAGLARVNLVIDDSDGITFFISVFGVSVPIKFTFEKPAHAELRSECLVFFACLAHKKSTLENRVRQLSKKVGKRGSYFKLQPTCGGERVTANSDCTRDVFQWDTAIWHLSLCQLHAVQEPLEHKAAGRKTLRQETNVK